jgi:multidrug transporter EmrE-like cation transporter
VTATPPSAGFLALQVVANLFFAWGGRTPDRWLACFVLGNAAGVSSIWFMTRIYAAMQPNVAMAAAGGGAFVLVQLALYSAFRQRLTGLQLLGLAAIAAGILLVSWHAPAAGRPPGQ